MSDIHREKLGVVIGAVTLGVAVGTLFLMDELFETVDGTAFIAILLVPPIVYAMVSGRISEFTGPGGWGAKFRSAATSRVEVSSIIEDTEMLLAIPKMRVSQLKERIRDLNPDLPNALTLRVGRSGFYRPEAIVESINMLMTVGSSTYVVFVSESSGRFVGSAAANQVISVLQTEEAKSEFMNELESGGENALLNLGFLEKESLAPDETNTSALKKFLDTNSGALIVVSPDDGKPRGIVDKNRLMTKLMVRLAGQE